MRDLEAQLEDERKQRHTAQSAQKKLESDLQDLENQVEAEAKGKEDAQRHYKKLHVSYPPLSCPFFLLLCLSPDSLVVALLAHSKHVIASFFRCKFSESHIF